MWVGGWGRERLELGRRIGCNLLGVLTSCYILTSEFTVTLY